MTEMTFAFPSELLRLLEIAGVRPEVVLHPTAGPSIPSSYESIREVHVVESSASKDGVSWDDAVREAVRKAAPGPLLVNAVLVPMRSVVRAVGPVTFRDQAALLTAVLEATDPGHTVVALVGAALVEATSEEPFRRWLVEAGFLVRWVLFLGEAAARALGAHPAFRMALVVFEKGAPGSTGLVRLVDLRSGGAEAAKARMQSAAVQKGGEKEGVIVLREGLDGDSWTFERFSRALAEVEREAGALGVLGNLRDVAEEIAAGPTDVKRAAGLISIDDEALPDGYVPCLAGRDISPAGELGRPARAQRVREAESRYRLRVGDTIVRSILGPGQKIAAALVTERDLPATFSSGIIRIRWRRDLPAGAPELLTDYLRSTSAVAWLRARGLGVSLTPSLLGRLRVPYPSEGVLSALESLRLAAREYRGWAEGVDDTRARLFGEASLSGSVKNLLERTGAEAERLQAARDSQTLGYRIRNYFPHPLALRYQALAQQPHGKERLEGTLELAEYLMTLLAILGIVQIRAGRGLPASELIPKLRSFVRPGGLTFDWGKKAAIVEEAVQLTTASRDALSLPVPGLVTMGPWAGSELPDWVRAEIPLRLFRNDSSHLGRLPESEIPAKSEEFEGHLTRVLSAASFLAATPVVLVEDCRLDPMSGQRTANTARLSGATPAFRREKLRLEEEVPAPCVAVVGSGGRVHSLFPWLLARPCNVCRRTESFVFSKFENGSVRYVAMETGHTQEFPELQDYWAAMLAGGPK